MSGRRGYSYATMAGGGGGHGFGDPRQEFLPRDTDPDASPEELRQIALKIVKATKTLLDPSHPSSNVQAKECGWASIEKLAECKANETSLRQGARRGREKKLFLQIIREHRDIFDISPDGTEMRRRDWRKFLARDHDRVCPMVLFGLPCKGDDRAECTCAHVPASYMRKKFKEAYCMRHYRHKLFDWFACPYREYCHEAHSREEVDPSLGLREPTRETLSIPHIRGKPVEPRPKFKAEKPCRQMLVNGACKLEPADRCKHAHHPKEIDRGARRKRELLAEYCNFGKTFDFGCPYGSDFCFYPHVEDQEDPHIKFQKRMIGMIQSGQWGNVYHHVFTSFDETVMKYALDHIEGWLYCARMSRQEEVGKIFLKRLAIGQGVMGTPQRRDNVMLEFSLYIPGMFDECLMRCHRGANLGTREVPSLPQFFKHLYEKGVRENIFKLEMVHDVAARRFASPLFDLSYEKGVPGRLRYYREAFEIAYKEEQEFLAAERKGDKVTLYETTNMGAGSRYGYGGGGEDPLSSSEDEQETEEREMELRRRLHNHPEYQKGGYLGPDNTRHALTNPFQTMGDTMGLKRLPMSALMILPRTPVEILQRLLLEAASIDHRNSVARELDWIFTKTGKYPELASTFLHWAWLDKPPLMYEMCYFQVMIEKKKLPQEKESFYYEIEDFDDIEEDEEVAAERRSRKYTKTDWSAFGKWRPKPLDWVPFSVQTRAFALDLVLASTSYNKMSVELLVEFFEASPIMPIRDLVVPGYRPAIFSAQVKECVSYLLKMSGRTVEDLREELRDPNKSTLLHTAAAWNREEYRRKEIFRGRTPKSLHGGLLLLRKLSVEMIRVMMYEKDRNGRHPRAVAQYKKNPQAAKLLDFLDRNPTVGLDECLKFIDGRPPGQGGNVRQ